MKTARDYRRGYRHSGAAARVIRNRGRALRYPEPHHARANVPRGRVSRGLHWGPGLGHRLRPRLVGCRTGRSRRRSDWCGLIGAFADAAEERARRAGVSERVRIERGCSEYRAPTSAAFEVATCLGESFVLGGYAAAPRRMVSAVGPFGRAVIGEPHALVGVDVPDVGFPISSPDKLAEVLDTAGRELTGLVPASQDDWDHYESQHWANVERWARRRSEHPRRAEFLAWSREFRHRCLTAERGRVGWSVLARHVRGSAVPDDSCCRFPVSGLASRSARILLQPVGCRRCSDSCRRCSDSECAPRASLAGRATRDLARTAAGGSVLTPKVSPTVQLAVLTSRSRVGVAPRWTGGTAVVRVLRRTGIVGRDRAVAGRDRCCRAVVSP